MEIFFCSLITSASRPVAAQTESCIDGINRGLQGGMAGTPDDAGGSSNGNAMLEDELRMLELSGL